MSVVTHADAHVSMLVMVLLTGCTCCPRFSLQPSGAPANEVVQEFPSRGTAQTAWRVRWATAPGKGLYITGAWFKRDASEPWMRVLWDARLSEIFVPYHTGSPRYYDLDGFGFDVQEANENDAGCCGRLLGSPEKVVWEVRDRGVLWKNDQLVRRGEELLLWATIDAANYNYIVHYGFRDDGSIAFRVAATAENLPGQRWQPHMHNCLWRIDIDLNGFGHDSALLATHVEPSGSPAVASDSVVPFNGGVEGHADWNPLEFTHVRVQDTVRKNAQDKKISYDLRPVRFGTPRHQENFTQHDFWVTRYKTTELYYPSIETFVSDGQAIIDTDVVLWHITPLHHHPRSEDGRMNPNWNGVALAMWGGFDLRPRDLFDQTPLYP